MIEDFVDVYLEAGMIGLVGVMFVYFVVSLNKKIESQQKTLESLRVDSSRQSDTIRNCESIIIKLIDRWDDSDNHMGRRHESFLKEVNDLRSELNYVRGKINGK